MQISRTLAVIQRTVDLLHSLGRLNVLIQGKDSAAIDSWLHPAKKSFKFTEEYSTADDILTQASARGKPKQLRNHKLQIIPR